MNNQNHELYLRFSKWISLSTSIMVLISFIIAITALPKSGPNCVASCVSYPYSDITKFFPNDYFWMIPASIAMMVYFILFTCIHYQTMPSKKIFSQISVNFASMATLILVLDYLVQLLVIQPSLINGEQEGIALLTQYNSHGIFIALEIIGYIIMVISFGFITLAIDNIAVEGKYIKFVFYISILLSILFFIVLYGSYGLDTGDRFEVAIIGITWWTLIIIGPLFYRYFKKQENKGPLIEN